MKAYVWTNPSEIQIREIPDPTATTEEVVVRVHYAGICGSDLSGYLGENSLRKPPLIMGHEFTGTIIAKDDSAQEREIGELVTVNPLLACGVCEACRRGFPQYCPFREIIGIHRPGAFAEFVTVPASACLPVSNEQSGSLTEPLACSIRAARQAGVQSGDAVAVFGAGIIGLFSVWAARFMGARTVVLVDTNQARLKLGTAFGATNLVDVHNGAVLEQITDAAGGYVQRAIDAVGLSETRAQTIQVVQPGGTAAWIGLHEEESVVPANLIVRKEVNTVGSFCYAEDDFQTAHRTIEKGHIELDNAWLSIRPAKDIQRSFDEQIHGPATYPKILLSLMN
ncbi:zinc-dependent alcohol dehydrogenase [Alicyclobacillus ferrooxydans]|uniref:Galactitol-1-phosphate 5-dehydrogenase n=1 Tax=Alicyclobacillus ferrooxydans TaxID=471514 RepID=A0A0P9CNV5_9BACL|nr:alcohol dehydrogenase catalytic domain-containing protein [Alicyclobacillus ferrooxydans]KPV40801.1 hypothetical protein AN477_21035 [Alicyclobacillus ferrooxydans]